MDVNFSTFLPKRFYLTKFIKDKRITGILDSKAQRNATIKTLNQI